MERQSPLTYDPATISPLNFASIMLPAGEYSTIMTNFPQGNCNKSWGEKADFFISCNVYQNGKKLGTLHGRHCDQDHGYTQFNFDDLMQFENKPSMGLIHTQFYHTTHIPVEIYFAHIHRKTGQYLAYPGLAFMGDEIYLETHTTQLENTLFWPGVLAHENNEVSMIVLNPYKLSYSYQLSLYHPNGAREQTQVFKVKPLSTRAHIIQECFPQTYLSIIKDPANYSLCIAAQYKVVAYVALRNLQTNCYTTIDHLHTYTMV